jgi:hypothetical protein
MLTDLSFQAFFQRNVYVIIRLQAWARGVVTRERIRAQLQMQELNPHHQYYASGNDGLEYQQDPNFNM